MQQSIFLLWFIYIVLCHLSMVCRLTTAIVGLQAAGCYITLCAYRLLLKCYDKLLLSLTAAYLSC